MASAILSRPCHFEIRDTPIPDPGPRQLRIRLLGSGIGPLDLAAWQDFPSTLPTLLNQPHDPLPPGAPGREGWGIIDTLGSDLGKTDLQPGQPVACFTTRAFAEYDIAPANAIVPLPEPLHSLPFPAHPLAGAINTFRRAFIESGTQVAILGGGFLSLLLIQLARLAQATIIVLSRNPAALQKAKALGATHTILLNHTREPIAQTLLNLTGGTLCDTVIETTGHQYPLTLASALARTRGRLIIAGHHCDAPRQIDLPLWNQRSLDIINAHAHTPRLRIESLREAVTAVATGLLNPTPLYTHRLPLAQINQAMHLYQQRPPGYTKALLLHP
jgi:threonine dehydrogenase-like Zn-dependent dehydrogenase